MSESSSGIPSGVRYFFGEEAHLRRTVEHTAMSIFRRWSYEEITPPTIDYYSLFERGMGATEAQRAFRFMDVDGRLLALRPDVTSSIARAAATLMAGRERPLRFSYAAPVFRMRGESAAEWRRESTQIGCELIGSDGSLADMEVLAIAVEILSALRLAGCCRITVNNPEVFNGTVENLRLDSAAGEELRHLVDTHNSGDLSCFLASYAPVNEGLEFARLVHLSGKNEILRNARRVISNARSVAALKRLEELWRLIDSLGLAEHFEVDLGDVSRLDYYTGLIFKIYVAGVGTRVGSGGRYDQLTASFGKREAAVGFVLDLDVLTDAMRANQTASSFAANTEAAASSLSPESLRTPLREQLEQLSKIRAGQSEREAESCQS
ncbi:MAG: ATP phosphoribosyltransferase regulatory subunit [Acidobacteria bacterium]|nr:ATP phosphoribosyltransferase regulatory subunit [Acidobacteriota bacterium]